MKRKQPKHRQKQAQQSTPKAEKARIQIALGRKNYIIMGVGLATIVAGFITLANGSMTLAPFLLVMGYCVVIPVSLIVK